MPLAVTIILIVLALGLIWLVYSLVWGTPPFFNLAVERLTFRMVRTDPELLTYLGLLDNTSLDFHSGSLTDASPRQMARRQQLDRDGLALIHRYRPEKLKGEKRVTYCAVTALITTGTLILSSWGPTRSTMSLVCRLT